MTIPNLRNIIPIAVVAVVVLAMYIFIANPFGKNDYVSKAETIQDYRARATAHMEKKEYQQALDLLLELEVMVPEDVAVHYSVARLYQSSNRNAEARAALERGMPYLTDPEANAAYAKMLSELE